MRERLRAGGEAVRAGLRRVAEFQARLLLLLLYLGLVAPVGLLLRLVADPLGRRRPASSNWRPRQAAAPTLEEAGRQ